MLRPVPSKYVPIMNRNAIRRNHCYPIIFTWTIDGGQTFILYIDICNHPTLNKPSIFHLHHQIK